MKRFSQWGLRLFFSVTIAFTVPSLYQDGGLFSAEPFWKGLALTVAAIVGKLAVGVFAGPPLTFSGFLKLGWAMNGRGEFSFLIAQEASDEGVLSAEDYSAVVWAILLTSLTTPFAFRRVMAADLKAQAEGIAANQEEDDDSDGDGGDSVGVGVGVGGGGGGGDNGGGKNGGGVGVRKAGDIYL